MGSQRADRREASRSRPITALDPVNGDSRGVTPVVSKTLEMGLVVLFVALVTTVLLSGVVPQYRSSAGAELSERVLVTASQEVENAVPPAGRSVETERTVDLPGSIADSGYRIRTDGRHLVLDHPESDIDGRVRLTLPPRVARVEGTWQSGAETIVRVADGPSGLVIELRNGGEP